MIGEATQGPAGRQRSAGAQAERAAAPDAADHHQIERLGVMRRTIRRARRRGGIVPIMVDDPSATPAPADVLPSWHRPISVAEYHHMIDAKVFDEDDPIELLEGFVARMSPQSLGHAHAIAYLAESLARMLPARFQMRCQLPLTLARSEPEPDLAVVERRIARRAAHHPDTAILVIEVAVDSLDKDRAKAAIYAEAGVKEYWIVDVVHRRVEVRRRPQRARRSYAEHAILGRGKLTSPLLPGVAVSVASLFRDRRRA
jgi:Uma2 family endonuclease